jgi:hypothetical protein
MARDEQVTPRQVAEAILAKVQELIGKSEVLEKAEKGVHKEINRHPGMSRAGIMAREAHHAPSEHPQAKETYESKARDLHRDVLASSREMPKPNLPKSEEGMDKYESENSKKLGTQAPHRHQEEVDKEDIVGKRRVRHQEDPDKNPKENAEGNNAAPGAQPYNVKKYGMEGQVRKTEAGMHKVEYHSANLEKDEKGVHEKSPFKHSGMETTEGSSAGNRVRNANKYGSDMKSSKDSVMSDAKSLHSDKLSELKDMPKPNLPKSEDGVDKAEEKKSSNDKFGMSVRQHLIDKVHHSMKQHGYKTHEASPNQFKEHAHNIGIKNLNGHEIVHGSDTYQHEGEELKKDGGIQAGIAAAGAAGGVPHTQTATPQGVQAGISGAFGKSESLKKDFGQNFANAAASGSITPAKIQQGARSVSSPAPSPSPAPAAKSEEGQVIKSESGMWKVEYHSANLKKALDTGKDAQAPKTSSAVTKSEMPAGKSIGSAKLAKFMEDKANKRLKKS